MSEQILKTLTEAVLAGAVEVLAAKRQGGIEAIYKDATELVTHADRRSDTAIRAVFERGFDRGVALRLEESGETGDKDSNRVAGADPIDGTNHFACGGNLYAVQAYYMEDGIPLAGVLFQPEAYLPLDQTDACLGRLACAIRGQGATLRRTIYRGGHLDFDGVAQPLRCRVYPPTRTYVASVPLGTKMTADERLLAVRVRDSGLVAAATSVGAASANVMMTVLGGQQVYANFGAGDDLDIVPPQIIAEEAGVTVWGVERRPPVWKHLRKQPVVFAPTPEVADQFFTAAGL